MRDPILLALVGFLLAASLLVAKAGVDAGGTPLIIALASTLGAGLTLLVASILGGARLPSPRVMGFYAVAGAVSYAIPNVLVFAAAGRIGPSFAAMLHTLVPALTYLVAIVWRMDGLRTRRLLGLMLGLAGAVTIVSARLGFSTPGETEVVLLALLAPALIAVGNVLRSKFWPSGYRPLEVASGMLTIAGLWIGLVLLAFAPGQIRIAAPAASWLAMQAILGAIYYALYFRLQHVAGPVYLSQIGYVAAGFAIPLGVLLFADRITTPMLIGVSLIVAGVLLVRPAGSPNQQPPRRKASLPATVHSDLQTGEIP